MSTRFFCHESVLTSQLQAVLGHFCTDTGKKDAKERAEENKSLVTSIHPLDRREVGAKHFFWLCCAVCALQPLGKVRIRPLAKHRISVAFSCTWVTFK